MDEFAFRAAVVGRVQSAEMLCVREGLKRELSEWEIREFPRLPDLIAVVPKESYFPDLVIVCQHWRDEYAGDHVRKALQILPLARWICVCGVWCESEGRHGSRWPAAVRVPISGLNARLILEANVVGGKTPALALTAGRDEIFEFGSLIPFPHDSRGTLAVRIDIPDPALGSWLSDLCQAAGLAVVDAKPAGGGESIYAVIADRDPLTKDVEQQFADLRHRHPEAKFVVVLGIVYPEDHIRLESAGADVVLSKLTPSAEILGTLERITGPEAPGHKCC